MSAVTSLLLLLAVAQQDPNIDEFSERILERMGGYYDNGDWTRLVKQFDAIAERYVIRTESGRWRNARVPVPVNHHS